MDWRRRAEANLRDLGRKRWRGSAAASSPGKGQQPRVRGRTWQRRPGLQIRNASLGKAQPDGEAGGGRHMVRMTFWMMLDTSTLMTLWVLMVDTKPMAAYLARHQARGDATVIKRSKRPLPR